MGKSLVAVIGFIMLYLAGCIDPAPAYQANLLTYDAELLGTWDLEIQGGEEDPTPHHIIVEITPRKESTSSGRLGQYNKPDESSAPKTIINAYRIKVTIPGKKATEESDPQEPQVHIYDANLLAIEGVTFLAYQPSHNSDFDRSLMMDYLPIHRVCRFERDADTVRVQFPKAQIVWLPSLKSLDAPAQELVLPTEDGQYFVESPDRLVEGLKMTLKSPDAWHKQVQAKRVQ